MQPDAANPFTALTLIAAPAILTNASSVLAMSTSNRLARAVDRARDLTRQLETAEDLTTPTARRQLRDLAAAEDRSLLLVRALRSAYVALSGFATAALVSLLGAVLLAFLPRAVGQTIEVASVVAGIVAVGGIVNAAQLLVRETRIAVERLSDRAEHVRERAAEQTGSGRT